MSAPYENPTYSKSRLLRRLFSCSGKFVGLRALPHALRSTRSALERKAFGRHPEMPFIPYFAIDALDRLVKPEYRIVEIGAGMSTLWLAERAALVQSYEWDEGWYSLLSAELEKRKASNVILRRCRGHEFMGFTDIVDGSVDLAFIDGGPRSLCLFNLWAKVKKGGSLYLDNWDSDLFWTEGGLDARDFLAERAAEIAKKTLFVDFVPA